MFNATPPPLAFVPEPVEQLRARFPKALETMHDLVECLLKRTSPAPMFRRAQVFDLTHNGVHHRLIVAVEKDPYQPDPYLHVSVTSGKTVRSSCISYSDALATLRLIWPAAPKPMEMMRSEYGVPNLFFKVPALEEVAHART